jgi:hypothetical protein
MSSPETRPTLVDSGSWPALEMQDWQHERQPQLGFVGVVWGRVYRPHPHTELEICQVVYAVEMSARLSVSAPLADNPDLAAR